MNNQFFFIFLILILTIQSASGKDKPLMDVSDLVDRVSPQVIIVKSENITKILEPGKLTVKHSWRIGSGFIVNPSGYILTCAHLVQDAEKIEIELKDQIKYDASIIEVDNKADLALMKINASDLPQVTIGKPDKIRQGDSVFTIGNPLPSQMNIPLETFKHSVVIGIISSTEHLNNYGLKLFQLSLPINYGNSGGPVFNNQGEVIGIVNAKMLAFNGKQIEGVGFALSIQEGSKMLKTVQSEILKQKVAMDVTSQNIKRWWLVLDLLLAAFILFAIIIVRRRRINNPYRIAQERESAKILLLDAIEQNKRIEFSHLLAEILAKKKDSISGNGVSLIDFLLKQNRQIRQNEWVLMELKKQLPVGSTSKIEEYLYKLKKAKR